MNCGHFDKYAILAVIPSVYIATLLCVCGCTIQYSVKELFKRERNKSERVLSTISFGQRECIQCER